MGSPREVRFSKEASDATALDYGLTSPGSIAVPQREGMRLAMRDFPAGELAWFYQRDPSRRWLRGATFRIVKRMLDVGGVILSSPITLPLGVLCAIAIRLESPLAASLFVQERTGFHGRRFRMFKFRTMVLQAEAMKAEMASRNKLQWPDFKVEHDSRVTAVGNFLRRTSLDELPQLLNVLLGDMSLVGPRPTSFSADTYAPWQKARLNAIPGLTGLWQVCGRGEMEFDERARLDIDYIERQSLSVDVSILVRTLGAVLSRKGAY